MRIISRATDEHIINKFLVSWLPESENPSRAQRDAMRLLTFEECEPFYFDVDSSELNNIFLELTNKGFVQSIKEIFQGNIFYRSDTEKCDRCYRYRPEVYYDKLKHPDVESVCNRCASVLKNK